jgi:MFS family permease
MSRIRNFLSGERTDTTSPPPYLLKLRSSKAFILTTICIAVFTDMFLYGIIVPVIPFALESRAGIPTSQTQHWTSILLAAYGAALLIISPSAGVFADRSSSRRLPLLLGLFALAGATVMLCLARTITLLVIGRVLQGFSAAVVWTVGFALLVDTVGQKDIGQTLGYVSISMSVSILVAPLLGGVVYQRAGYYAVFYLSFSLIALDIFMRLVLIEKKIAQQWVENSAADEDAVNVSNPAHGLDSDTIQEDPEKSNIEAANISGLVPEMESIWQGGSASPDDRQIYESAATTTNHEVSKYPAIVTLLKSRRLLTALWGVVVQGSQNTAFDSVVPLFVQRTFHWDSTGAGLIFLAVMIPSFSAPAVGWASDNYGPRWICVGGFLSAIPFWTLLRLVDHDSIGQKVLLCALLALIGVSLTLVMSPLLAEITYVVEAKEKQSPGRFGVTGAYAQAYGLFVTAFAAGTLIGPIWGGYVEDAAGWGTMAWTLGLFNIAGAIPCLIYTGGLITDINAKTAEERAIGKVAMQKTPTTVDAGEDGTV